MNVRAAVGQYVVAAAAFYAIFVATASPWRSCSWTWPGARSSPPR
ncbi:MAG: hypothetical protein ACXWDI_10195 [Nocardioides sp.]